MKKLFLFLVFIPSYLWNVWASDLKIIAMDKELDFPLEGVSFFADDGKTILCSTDENGTALLNLKESDLPIKIKARLAGYDDCFAVIKNIQSDITVYMSISGVVEGEELVVKRQGTGLSEEKTGVSTVMTKEEMHTTANIGLVEDCMASVRTLPGVSFSSSFWGTEPSVRGGQPRELGFCLDGMYIIFPYHWGGGVSIFNPAMVESITLSNGVFSAKYGRGSSGFLEATTIKADFENYHGNFNLSTTCADGFVQIPFGKNIGGMIFGTHLSFLEPFVWAYKKSGGSEMDFLKRAPYIRDFFLKANFTPVPELDVAVTGFFGSDGLEIDQSDTTDGITTRSVMDYDYYQILGGINVKYLLSDRVFFHGTVSYNNMIENMKIMMSENGTVKYSDDFVDKYGALYSDVDYGKSYSLNNLNSKNNENIRNHLVTARLDGEFEITEKNHFTLGIEELFSTADTEENFGGWTDIEAGGERYFKNVKAFTRSNGNCIFDNAAFACWNYGKENDFFQSEAGVRAEFVVLRNTQHNYNLCFIPDICPRLNMTLTPLTGKGSLEKLSFTLGTGVFSSIPRETMIFTEEMGLKSFDMHTDRALLFVLGSQAEFDDGLKIRLETYYRHYLSRIYTYEALSSSSGYEHADFAVKTKGKGRVFGVDAFVEKKSGKIWDGYLSYSFVYAKFFDGANIANNETADSMFGSPLDEWYFPYYHRFHTLNLVSNLHFGKGWTFTAKATLATGCPKEKEGKIASYASVMDDGTVIQRYSRSYSYSDILRSNLTCPIDLRISKQWKSDNEKKHFEFYFALQDINFVPQGQKETFNAYTGKMTEVSDDANFSLGVPIPSLGFKMSF